MSIYSYLASIVLIIEYYLLNPLIKVILKSPLNTLIDQWFLILKYDGRRSGNTYTTPLLYRVGQQGVVLFASRNHTNWWKNFNDGYPLMVYQNGEWIDGRGAVNMDNQDIYRHLSWLFSPLTRLSGYLPGRRFPSRCYLEDISGRFVLVEVSLEE